MDLIADVIYTRGPHKGITARERFWRKVQVGATDDCWLFSGAPSQPYGKFVSMGQQYTPSRFSYYLTHGRFPVPDALHSCDTPRCVNPAHLREGTPAENAVDMVLRGRSLSQRGGGNHAAKLTDEQVIEIKSELALGVKGLALAHRYGVSQATVSEIKTGKHWVT